MNLSLLSDLLKAIDPSDLVLSNQIQSDSSGRNVYRYDNVYSYKKTVALLQDIDFFKPYVQDIRMTDLYRTGEDISYVSVEENPFVKGASENLYYRVLIVREFLKNELGEDGRNSVRIKLPPVKDFDEVAQAMNDLKRAISIPLADIGEGEVRIERPESGSFWLLVTLFAPKAVTFIAKMWWAAMSLRQRSLEIDLLEKQLQGFNMSIEQQKYFMEKQRELMDALVTSEVAEIYRNAGSDAISDPEVQGRAILALNTMQDLIEKGGQLFPSLNSDEKVKELFPPNSLYKLVESKTKQLSEGDKSPEGGS